MLVVPTKNEVVGEFNANIKSCLSGENYSFTQWLAVVRLIAIKRQKVIIQYDISFNNKSK